MMDEMQETTTVDDGYVVILEYTVRFDDGEVVASSDDDGELAFIQGRGHVFPVIERAVKGLRVGDEANLVMAPEDAYGAYDPEAQESLPLEMFPEGVEIVEGLEVELSDEESGDELEAVVVQVGEDAVVLDLNHPLAGETLTMRFRIVDIRPATDEELAHDHVHDD